MSPTMPTKLPRFPVLVLLAALATLLAAGSALALQPNGMLVFLTDFGVEDDAVAICKGVMLTIDPDLEIIDLTHQVTPFDIREGALYLAEAARYFPEGTVFVGVVDPGVGTRRRAIVLETDSGQAFVAPDNGLLWLVAQEQGVRSIREITNPELMRPHPSTTFHGRDVFAPAGAWLASGKREPEEAGAALAELLPLHLSEPSFADGRMSGEVFLLDKAFGNVWTNIPRKLFNSAFPGKPDRLQVKVGSRELTLPLVATFGDVPAGRPLAYFNSRDHLSFAVNLGSFAATFGIQAGDSVQIRVAR